MEGFPPTPDQQTERPKTQEYYDRIKIALQRAEETSQHNLDNLAPGSEDSKVNAERWNNSLKLRESLKEEKNTFDELLDRMAYVANPDLPNLGLAEMTKVKASILNKPASEIVDFIEELVAEWEQEHQQRFGNGITEIGDNTTEEANTIRQEIDKYKKLEARLLG